MQIEIIKALGNPVRLKLIKCISSKEKTVSELITNCGLSQSAVSQHLSKLKKANVVKTKKAGREIKYSLSNKKLIKISSLLLNLIEEN